MRWKSLFDDLEAQLDAAQQEAIDAEISDRVRSEQGGVVLVDRLRGHLGFMLRVTVAGGEVFAGELTQVGSGWLVLSKAPTEVMVPLPAVRLVEGLGRHVVSETSRVRAALGMAAALRALSRDRSLVTVHRTDSGSRIVGVIDRVGKDFLEIAAVLPGEVRRSASVSGVYAVPFSGIAAVSSNS